MSTFNGCPVYPITKEDEEALLQMLWESRKNRGDPPRVPPKPNRSAITSCPDVVRAKRTIKFYKNDDINIYLTF